MAEPQADTPTPIGLDRVICGVDSSPQSLEAAAQMLAIASPGAKLWAVSVWDPSLARHAGIHASRVRSKLREEGVAALTRASESFPGMTPVLIQSGEVSGLLSAAAEENVDLISVGSHGGRRLTGLAFGSVASAMAHNAPCSVLIARPAAENKFPGLLVHASDGSADSLDAAQVAGAIAARHGSKVLSVSFDDDLDRARAVTEEATVLIEGAGAIAVAESRKGSPHRGIVKFADTTQASLVVIGSRGMTGLKALGSVSERVAHRAPCSVLIVRRAAHPRGEIEGEEAESS
ncbi:MAG: universal stress protein [Actinobacteria bacterium]|nr:universal stress protein [Actinomycetota bacterium]